MLTAMQLEEINLACREVAQIGAGYGAVVVVIERGRARRIRQEIDRSWGQVRSEPIQELNSDDLS